MKSTSQDQKDPKTRLSYFSSKYPTSTEADWSFFQKNIWIHSSELLAFRRRYGECVHRKRWYPLDKLVGFFNEKTGEQKGFIHVLAAEKLGLAVCPYLKAAIPKSMMIEAFSSSENPIMISTEAAENAGCFFKDNFDGKYHHDCNRMKVTNKSGFQGINAISKHSLMANPSIFIMCFRCSKVLIKQAPDFVEFKDTAGSLACHDCYVRWKVGQVIMPHDYRKYHKEITSNDRNIRLNDSGKRASTLRRLCFPSEVRSDCRLIGVEIETQFTRKKMRDLERHILAHQSIEALGNEFAFVKHDGSLAGNRKDGSGGDFGFEIVSAPADLRTHRLMWPKLHDMPDFSKLRAWDTLRCGMHVHFEKALLSTLQIGRVLIFVNHPANRSFMQKVAGRSETNYCRYLNKKYRDCLTKLEWSDDNRRQAFNVVPEKTVEFRMFRGTVNPRHIIRNIEFCDALLSFCGMSARSLREMGDYGKFILYCSDNRKTWPLLNEWLARLELIPFKKPGEKAKAHLMTLRPDLCLEGEEPDKTLVVNAEEEDRKAGGDSGESDFSDVLIPSLTAQFISGVTWTTSATATALHFSPATQPHEQETAAEADEEEDEDPDPPNF